MLSVYKLGYIKVNETNSQILPLTVVSCHSQELPSILDDATLSVSDRSAHLNALKMNCYALIRLLESFENMTSRTSLINLDVGGKVKWEFLAYFTWGGKRIDGKETSDSRMFTVLVWGLGGSPQVPDLLP